MDHPAVGEEMFRHFQARGDIDQIRETRPEWSEQRYHYDFRIEIGGRLLTSKRSSSKTTRKIPQFMW